MNNFIYNETTKLLVKMDDIRSARMVEGNLTNGSKGWRIMIYFSPAEGHIIGEFTKEVDAAEAFEKVTALMHNSTENQCIPICDVVEKSLVVVPNKEDNVLYLGE